jgi:hypothetical protein
MILIARAPAIASARSETTDSIIIIMRTRVVNGIVSVGLKAVAVLKARKRYSA